MSFSKLISCAVHGSIRVSPVALRIINTPEFQRTRHIKQLGLCYYVYPSATHSRFAHALGVYHLAGKVIEILRLNYPGKLYDIPEYGGKTMLTSHIAEMIKIAGLCHDIGHGPFSHIFDDVLLKQSTSKNRFHEERSKLIIEMICKREMTDVISDADIKFIQNIIDPTDKCNGAIYQIVSNHLNGIDVDKFDYLARDPYTLNLCDRFDHMRLISELIIDSNDNLAYPKHSSMDVLQMFHTRYTLHKKVYSHKTVKLLECMLSDIFKKIDPIFKLSDYIEDMNKFCKLTDDSIFHMMDSVMNPSPFMKIDLNNSDMNNIASAWSIYNRMLSRDLYKIIIESDDDKTDYYNQFIDWMKKRYDDFDTDSVGILKIKVGFVSGHEDPFDNIYFYDKKENNKTFTMDKTKISAILSGDIFEVRTYLYSKNQSKVSFIRDHLEIYQLSQSNDSK